MKRNIEISGNYGNNILDVKRPDKKVTLWSKDKMNDWIKYIMEHRFYGYFKILVLGHKRPYLVWSQTSGSQMSWSQKGGHKRPGHKRPGHKRPGHKRHGHKRPGHKRPPTI